MQNLLTTSGPPAGLSPREALREMCSLRRVTTGNPLPPLTPNTNEATASTRSTSSRGPSPYNIWQQAGPRPSAPNVSARAAQGTALTTRAPRFQPRPPSEPSTNRPEQRPLSAAVTLQPTQRAAPGPFSKSSSPPRPHTVVVFSEPSCALSEPAVVEQPSASLPPLGHSTSTRPTEDLSASPSTHTTGLVEGDHGTVRAPRRVTVDAFIDSGDDAPGGALPATADQSASARTAPSARRGTAKPTEASASTLQPQLPPSRPPSQSEPGSSPAGSMSTSAAALLQYVNVADTPRGLSGKQGSDSGSRRDQVIADWRLHATLPSTPAGALSGSTRKRHKANLWRLLTGYIHVKHYIRRWRQRFAEKQGSLLEFSKMRSCARSFARMEETPDTMMAGLDTFEWHVSFAVPYVSVRGAEMFDATVHLSTSHLHVSNDSASATLRLTEIIQVQPTTCGLCLRLAPPSRSVLGRGESSTLVTTQLHRPNAKSSERSLRRRPSEVRAREPDAIIIETADANYLALHIFDFQSRILRAYATTLAKTLTVRHGQKQLHVVHFNDVYHLPPFKPATARGVVGGASRFHTMLRQIRETLNPLVLFSGDFMGPSLMSVITKGKQMIDAMNFLGVHYGCFGNHEFDFGLRTLKEVIHGYTQGKHIYPGSQTTWVMSNMTEADGTPLGGAKPVEVVTWNGVRVGILGLCENWLPQCGALQPGEAQYHDMFERGQALATRLKEEEGCEVVLALTHNRLAVDKELTAACPAIDYLLGGHDHFYKSDPKCRVLKSGQEFEYLSLVEYTLQDRAVAKVRIDTRPVMYDTPQSEYMKGLIERYDRKMEEKLGKPIGTSDIPLDSTEETIRFGEGLLPNFVLDIIQDESGADLAVLGAAAIAGKDVKPPGTVTIGDVFAWFPNDTKIMTMELPGRTICKMLDVMVRELPAEAPSFPHPSRALSFTINMMARPVRCVDVMVNGKPIEMERWYTVAVEEFVGIGKAKYKFVPVEGRVLVNDENAPQLVHWVMDYFLKHKGTETSAEGEAREEALRVVKKAISSAARMEIDADAAKSQVFVCRVISQLLDCDRSALFLIDQETGELSFTSDHNAVSIRVPKGVGIAGHVAETSNFENIPDVYVDPRFNQSTDRRTGYRTRSMLACPVLRSDGKAVAVMQAINKNVNGDFGPFDAVDELKLRLIGEQVGFQLRNAQIYRDLSFEAIEASTAQMSGDFTCSSEGASFTRLSKHMEATFKAFAGEVSLNTSLLLGNIADFAVKLIPSDGVRVFVRNAAATGFVTLVNDMEDDETVTAAHIEPTTVLAKCLAAARTTVINNARDQHVLSTDREGNSFQTALVSSMVTAEGDIVGAIVWLNRKTADRSNKRFDEVDEFAAKFFGRFAAVACLNTMRLETLEELQQVSSLQAVPHVTLGRIRIRGGWATVRQKLKEIPALATPTTLKESVSSSHSRRKSLMPTSPAGGPAREGCDGPVPSPNVARLTPSAAALPHKTDLLLNSNFALSMLATSAHLKTLARQLFDTTGKPRAAPNPQNNVSLLGHSSYQSPHGLKPSTNSPQTSPKQALGARGESRRSSTASELAPLSSSVYPAPEHLRPAPPRDPTRDLSPRSNPSPCGSSCPSDESALALFSTSAYPTGDVPNRGL